MTKATKILVAGLGGVGGFFGGLLARKFEKNKDVEIYFLARGEHLKQIKEKGLKVIKGAQTFTAQPFLATNNTSEIGLVDFILICTKTFDLESTLLQLKPCIGKETILIPFLNGVNSTETIKIILPEANVCRGCAYIVSRLKEPGVIENSGNIQKLFFGSEGPGRKLVFLEKILKEAGIDATHSEKILSVLWEKYIFISPTATVTSYYDNTIGQICESDEKLQFFIKLTEEVCAIARAKGIDLDKDIVSKTIEKLKSLPYDATSSMHSDFRNKRSKTELDALTEYVIKSGNELNISTPTFKIVFECITKKQLAL